jgi:hypothetical protein
MSRNARDEKVLQYFCKRRQPQAFRGGLRNLQSLVRRIVANHGLAIGRAPHIELKPIATVLQAQLKRRQRIFRNVPGGPRAMMAEQKGCQSKSKSRIGRPVSGVSLAFFTAS